MNEIKIYALIVKNIKDLDSLYNDMENNGCGVYDCCPHRSVNCVHKKPSSRVTYYHITKDEAELLKNDPRIEKVTLGMQERDISVVLNIDSYSKLPGYCEYNDTPCVLSPKASKNWGLLYSSANGNISNWSYSQNIKKTVDTNDVSYEVSGLINRGGWNTPAPTGQIPTVEADIYFDPNAMGENIDIVIVDDGVKFDHPEFAVNSDGTGGSRCVPYNWFQHDLEVKGIPPTGTYVYSDAGDHGTHVAGIAAGNTHGWARKANIYSLNVFDYQIESFYWFDYIKAFHNSKMNSRPTIVNCSFGFNATIGRVICDVGCSISTNIQYALSISGFPAEIKDIVYQNTHYSGGRFMQTTVQSNPTPVSWEDGVPVFGSTWCCDDADISPIDCLTKGSTVCPGNENIAVTNGTIRFDDVAYNTRRTPNITTIVQGGAPGQVVSFRTYEDEISVPEIDADVADLESAGAIVIVSAGNRNRYIAASGDINFNNKLIVHPGAYDTEYYYMRRSSPGTENTIFVGSLSHQNFSSNRDPIQKPSTSVFSNRGPGVDIWAPGGNIVSSVANAANNVVYHPFARTDPRNSGFYLDIYSGTSMAAPQVAGVLACIMSADQTVNATNAKEKLLSYGRKDDIYYGFESQANKPTGVGPNVTQLLNPLNSGVILLNPYTIAKIINPIITKDVIHEAVTEPKIASTGFISVINKIWSVDNTASNVQNNSSKNGTIIVGCSKGGKYLAINNNIVYENINNTINFFDDRFDDPKYYYGGPANSEQPPIIAPNTTPPVNVSNSANFYGGCLSWNGQFGNVNTVGTNGGPSYYGTFDQTGNVAEWTDVTGLVPWKHIFRGGSWYSHSSGLPSTYNRFSVMFPVYFNSKVGFRIASSFSDPNPLDLPNFVSVGNINNNNDTTGYGGVSYSYQIGKYTITNGEYAEFLNSIANNDTYSTYHDLMGQDIRCGINRIGAQGSYRYEVKPNMCNKPVTLVSWFDAARYCNWLHNGKPTGPQNSSTTEDGAYSLNGAVNGNTIAKNSNAQYHIPTENEWYKAAYYSPVKNGVNSPGYYLYATQSDTTPICVFTKSNGDGISRTNTYQCPIPTNYLTSTPTPTPTPTPTTLSAVNFANFNLCGWWYTPPFYNYVTTVGTNGGPSYYGTFDQNGNVWEWNDLDGLPGGRGLRGGSWSNAGASLISSYRAEQQFFFARSDLYGFRLASFTNPLNLTNFVNINNTNNNNDTTGYGQVEYSYKIGKYTVTNSEYIEFLNAVASTDTYTLYTENFAFGNYSTKRNPGITRNGSSGSYTYTLKPYMSNKPVIFVNWFDAARYCNWLHNGKPTGPQNSSTTEDGAYSLNGVGSGIAPAKNSNAQYHIPTENEWYKAAYYSPVKNILNGVNSPGYYLYATQRDTIPTCVSVNRYDGNGLM